MSSVQLRDPFSGVWTFNRELSTTSTPPPRNWTQLIDITGNDVTVSEEIVSFNGSKTISTVWARFDGREYSIAGSQVSDTIAYVRHDRHNISGTGKKNGNVSLRQHTNVSPDGRALTLTYSIYSGVQVIAQGTAVFDKAHD